MVKDFEIGAVGAHGEDRAQIVATAVEGRDEEVGAAVGDAFAGRGPVQISALEGMTNGVADAPPFFPPAVQVTPKMYALLATSAQEVSAPSEPPSKEYRVV
jgi:hypothetical protein